jgi:hypothetical protein
VNPPNGYAPTPASGTIPYSGTNTTVTISFARALYNVTFQESGLPSGTVWSVTFNGTTLDDTTVGTSGSITFSVFDGSYAYTVGSVANYNSNPPGGTQVVSGANVNVPVVFTHVPVPYLVTFTESGLVAGTTWAVTLGSTTHSSTNTTVVFSELNATYIYPNAGTITVAGQNTGLTVVFAPPTVATFAVLFDETGLATGTNWSVTVGASTLYSNGASSVTFELANDSYSYTVNAVPNYQIEKATGTFQVAGQAQQVPVTFVSAPVTYTITFSETGLNSGVNWSVTIGTTTHYSNGAATVTFQEVNGVYNWQIGSLSGYSVSSSTGTVTLTGQPESVTVVFTSTGGGTTSSSGLSTLDWALIGIVIAIIVIALVVALVMRGRGGSGTPATTETTSTTTSETTTTPETWSEGNPPGTSP